MDIGRTVSKLVLPIADRELWSTFARLRLVCSSVSWHWVSSWIEPCEAARPLAPRRLAALYPEPGSSRGSSACLGEAPSAATHLVSLNPSVSPLERGACAYRGVGLYESVRVGCPKEPRSCPLDTERAVLSPSCPRERLGRTLLVTVWLPFSRHPA